MMAQQQNLQNDSGWYLIFAVVGTFSILVFFNWELRLLVYYGILGLLVLAVVTFTLNIMAPRMSPWWYWVFPKTLAKEQDFPEEELAFGRQVHREKIQEEHKQKASKYQEEVLSPRDEAKRQQLEKEFYDFTGPAWKGKAERLGNPDDASIGESKVKKRLRPQGTGKDAASVRKLPESVTRPPPQPERKEKPKRIITLPDEPDEGSPECITVAMRGTTGKVNKRRFFYTNQVQVLLDWMTKQGYHFQLYTLCTTYPKQDIYQHAQQTLKDIGITKDTLLTVEEREERLPDRDLELQE